MSKILSDKTKIENEKKRKDNLHKKIHENKTEIMFRKRCFIHHYISQKINENEFTFAIRDNRDLIQEYESLNNNNFK